MTLLNKDIHYTSKELAQHLTDKLVFSNYDFFVEPSAGAGAFSDLLPADKRFCYDIQPATPYTIEHDFLTIDIDHLLGHKVLTIGNPPFGYRAQSAISFFNKAAEYSRSIAFIVPRSFRKAYIINQLNRNFWLTYEEDVEIGSFESGTNARTCFQIWGRMSSRRKIIEFDTKSKHFRLVPNGKNFSPKDEYIAIRRTGHSIKNIAEVKEPKEALPTTQFIFIEPTNIHKDIIISNINNLDMREIALRTVNSPTFTVGEFITAYNEKYDAKEKEAVLEGV